jgi:hypothetical protein
MDRYYYDYSGGMGGGRRNGSHLRGLLFPFILLIVIGVVLVLGFKLYRTYYGSDSSDFVYMYVVSGQADVKMWGEADFSKAYTGTKILQGDEIRTSKDSRVVVEFFDGIKVRLNGDTQIAFSEIYNDSKGTSIKILLTKGEVWVNKTDIQAGTADFYVSTGNISVKAVSAIFDVEYVDDIQSVCVLQGSLDVGVYGESGETSVDHIVVDADNEASFDVEKLKRFWEFQAPNVVEKLSDKFKQTPWFAWNIKEDENPTPFEEDLKTFGGSYGYNALGPQK